MRFMQGSQKIEAQVESGELPLTSAVVGWQHLMGEEKKISVEGKEDVTSKILGKSASEARDLLKNNKAHQKKREVMSKMKVNVDILQKLEELKAMLGKEEIEILEELLDDKIERLKKKREKQANRPTGKGGKSQTRTIPTRVEAEVRIRAKDQCENVDIQRVRCGCRSKLEMHHIKVTM